MKQKTIKRVVSMCLIGTIALSLVACANSQKTEEPSSTPEASTIEPSGAIPSQGDEPSEANQGQEAEQSSAPTPSQDEPTPNQEPSEAPSQEPQEPNTSTPEPTPSEATPTSTPTTTPTPTSTLTPIHTHNFKGGTYSTPSKCECGEVGTYGDHTWTTKEIYHEATGHMQTDEETQEVIVGYESYELLYLCPRCSYKTNDRDDLTMHSLATGHGGAIVEKQGINPIYETQVISSTTYWVEDTPAWTENITTCSTCGTTK